MRNLFNPFSSDLAIDLGTANTLVYAKGRGIVVSEPSIVAINKITNKVEAVGKEAKEMLGRTPGNIIAIRPMKDGVIADFEVTEKMLQHFIRKAHNGRSWVSPRVVIGVPGEITQVERRAVEDAAYRAKASKVYLVAEAMAAAIGSSMRYTWPAPAPIADSLIARRSTCVEPQGTQMMMRGEGEKSLLSCTFLMNCFSICSVTVKSAITPSFIGRMAMMLPGVLPSISFASLPTAWMVFLPFGPAS